MCVLYSVWCVLFRMTGEKGKERKECASPQSMNIPSGFLSAVFWVSQVVVLDSLPLAGPTAICFVDGHPINPVMKHSLGEGGSGVQQKCYLFTFAAMPGRFIYLTSWFSVQRHYQCRQAFISSWPCQENHCDCDCLRVKYCRWTRLEDKMWKDPGAHPNTMA